MSSTGKAPEHNGSKSPGVAEAAEPAEAADPAEAAAAAAGAGVVADAVAAAAAGALDIHVVMAGLDPATSYFAALPTWMPVHAGRVGGDLIEKR
jgi:hypothetical protein